LKTHGIPPNANKYKKNKSNSNQTNSTTITTSTSAPTENTTNTTTVNLTTLTSNNTSFVNLLPIVSYFTPRDLSVQHSDKNEGQVIIPTTQSIASTSETQVVYEEIPIENLTFATLIRPQLHDQHFCDDSHQILSLRADSFINNNSNNNYQIQQKCNYDQNNRQIDNLGNNQTNVQNSEPKNCRLCKQEFIDVRQHLIDYHKIIFNEFDEYLHFIF